MATTYDNASLVMIPSGVKEDKLYSIKPTDGSGDFTFSRGSDIQATRVNSSGLIEKAKVNLTTFSNDPDNWVKSSASVTSGQSGYDGTSDAWLLTSTAAGGNTRRDVSWSGVSTFSIYAKAGTAVGMRIRLDAATDRNLYVNLSTGSVITDQTEIGFNIEAVSGGWYRISSTNNIVTGINYRIYPVDATGTAVAGTIYIQDAALCYGLIAQDYVETTTTAVVEGLTADLPRLDYSGGASCPSLLLEPSRTNLITQSEYFGAWSGSAVYTANTDISPSGYQDAATLNDNTTGYLDRRLSASITANATHTFTFFVKKTTGSLTHYAGMAVLLTGGATRVDYGIINTTTGEINRDVSSNVNSASYSSVSYGDYWRVIMTFTDNQSNTLCTSIVYPAISTNGTSISPSAQGSNVFWGADLVAASYPTSYIPTYAAAANRGQDSGEITSASAIIGQTEGTMFLQVGDFPQEFNGRIFAITQNSSNYITILKNGTNNDFYALCAFGGATQLSYQGTGSLSDNAKIAIGYANNDFVIYVNGTQVHTDTSGSVPTCSNIFIGKRENGTTTYSAGGELKQALLFKTRLTNAELAALTTL